MSESNSKIAAALLKVQKEISRVTKDKENPFFKSKYADLTQVIDHVKPILNKHGITFVQLPVPASREGYLGLTTMLLHESGESIAGVAEIPLAKQDPQGFGSAVTYGRRYALASVVGLIVEGDDDDAEGAVNRGKTEGGLTKPQTTDARTIFRGRRLEASKQAKPPVRGKAKLFPVPAMKAAGEEGGEDSGQDKS